MKQAIAAVLVPLKYQEKFKWGLFQPARLFIHNCLNDAIFIRDIWMADQLPIKIAWYAKEPGEVASIYSPQLYAHYRLAPGQTAPIFATGLVLPEQKLRLTIGRRMNLLDQEITISFVRMPMAALRQQVFFPLEHYHATIARYGVLDKRRERDYKAISSLPEQRLTRKVLAPDLDKLPLEQFTLSTSLELGNVREKYRIEKVVNPQQPKTLFYYCNPLNQWFIQDGNRSLLIQKLRGKLASIEIPGFDLRLLDVLEDNPRQEAALLLQEKFRGLLRPCGVEMQGNYAYVGYKKLLNVIDMMKINHLKISLSQPHSQFFEFQPINGTQLP